MAYIEAALAGRREGHRLAWAVRDLSGGRVVGSTSYHDIVAVIDRVEIGYTWYAQSWQSWQRSHVNTACKLLLLAHASRPWAPGGRASLATCRHDGAVSARGGKL